jgi:hypothetical protein
MTVDDLIEGVQPVGPKIPPWLEDGMQKMELAGGKNCLSGLLALTLVAPHGALDGKPSQQLKLHPRASQLVHSEMQAQN